MKVCYISGDTKDKCISFDVDGNVVIPAGLIITTNDGKGNSFQSVQTGSAGTSYSYLYIDFADWSNPILFVQNSRIPSSLDSVKTKKNLYLLGSVRVGSRTAVLNCNYYKMLSGTKGIWSEQEIVNLTDMKVCNISGDTKDNCISFDVEGNMVIPRGLIVTTNDGKGNTFQSVQTASAGTSYSYLYINFTDKANPTLFVQNSKIPSSLDSVRSNKNLYLLGSVRVGSKTAVLNCNYYKMQGEVKGIWSEQEIRDLVGNSSGNPVSDSVSPTDLRTLYNKFQEVSTSLNWYGIRIDRNDPNPRTGVVRIGNMQMHKELPIQSLMKRCVLKDDGSIRYYLNPENSNLKSDSTNAVIDGTDGQVMVEIPEYYVKFETSDSSISIKISTMALDGFVKSPKCYTGAYEASVYKPNNTVVNVPNNNISEWKLSSVCTSLFEIDSIQNTIAIRDVLNEDYTTAYSSNALQYRGNNNNVTFSCYQPELNGIPDDVIVKTGIDLGYYSMLGRPAAVYSSKLLYETARERGVNWISDTYHVYQSWVWLAYIEFATRNIQEAFNKNTNSGIIDNGCKQGGLGEGATWYQAWGCGFHNGVGAMIPCGVTNRLGNHSGIVTYKVKGSIYATRLSQYKTFATNESLGRPDAVISVPSYRGIENPFGHIYSLFNASVLIETFPKGYIDTTVAGKFNVWVAKDPFNTVDTVGPGYNYSRSTLERLYYLAGTGKNAHYDQNASAKDIIFGNSGCIVPGDFLEAEAGEDRFDKYWGDKYYLSYQSDQYRHVFSLTAGGTLDVQKYAGFLYFHLIHFNTAEKNYYRGTRLNYIPSNTVWEQYQ
jgi:hypothetical protein